MQVLFAEIRAFPGLLVLLIASTYGLDSICDAAQDASCYGALGGPVYLQLMRDTSGHTLSFHNEHEGIFRHRKSKTLFYNEFNIPSFIQRWQFVPDNGTLIINPSEKRDAGRYRVEIHEDSTGKRVGLHTVQLIIEATSAPTASSPPHHLTSISMVTNNTLGSNSVLILGAVLGGVVFLCVSMAVFCICKKKKKDIPTIANSYEVEYAEVSFKKRRETEERRKLAETVDYGEVTFRKKGETEERRTLAETVDYGEVTFRKKGETEEKRTLAETVDYGEVRLPKPTCNTQQEDSVYAQVRRGQ